MNEKGVGRLSYEELRTLICNYFKKNQKLELNYPSIDYFKEYLKKGSTTTPTFIVETEFGEYDINIPKEDIEKIFRSFLADRKCELTSFEYEDEIYFSYTYDPNIDQKPEEKVKLDLTYKGRLDYDSLRDIVYHYYKVNKGIQLTSISTEYLIDKLAKNVNNQPLFIKQGESGETRIDISKEDINEIIKSYLASKNYKLLDLDYGDKVIFRYKQGVEQETMKAVQTYEPKEIVQEVKTTPVSKESIPPVETPEESEVIIEEPIPVKDEELERMKREDRRFTIIQRERAMSEAQKGKNRSALMAGACILGASAASFLSGQDIHQVLQHEMDAIYSWEALGQYIQDLGPLTTLLAVGAGGFIAKYLKDSKKFKKAQQEFVDFNASLEKTNTAELGGNENDKSR